MEATQLIDNLRDDLEKKRNIKPISAGSYLRNLKILMKLLEVENPKNLNFLSNPEKVIDKLEGKKNSTIRNYLASIVVLLSLDEKYNAIADQYRELMDEYNQEYSKNVKEGKKTDSQQKNWTTLEELRKVLSTYKKELDLKNSLKKSELSKKEMDLLQKYVVGNLYIGDSSNPPLRLDYGNMDIITKKEYNKLSEEQKTKKNYLVIGKNKQFSIGEYKTSKSYGTKMIPVGSKLNKILNIWLRYNKGHSLLVNSNGKSMNSNALTKYLIKTFAPTGKQVSASLLRHIYLTEELKPVQDIKEKISENMLHSVSQQSDYIKK